jgi:death-on-curing protein
VTTEYVELIDYLAIAAEVTGLDVKTTIRVAKLDLAGSALHAPAAGFGDTAAPVLLQDSRDACRSAQIKPMQMPSVRARRWGR